jgi:acetyl esterase
VDHITPGLPPAIIVQGRDDTVTPLKGVQEFHDKLVACGNYCELWIYDGVGHLFTPTALGDNGWPRPDKAVEQQADERTEAFLRKFGFISR